MLPGTNFLLEVKFLDLFVLCFGIEERSVTLTVMGRQLKLSKVCGRLVDCTFNELCSKVNTCKIPVCLPCRWQGYLTCRALITFQQGIPLRSGLSAEFKVNHYVETLDILTGLLIIFICILCLVPGCSWLPDNLPALWYLNITRHPKDGFTTSVRGSQIHNSYWHSVW